ADGSKDKKSSEYWHAMGVPGTVAGMYAAWERYGSGKLTWKQLLAPAIELAEKGFPVNYDLAQILSLKRGWLLENAATAKAYYKKGGVPYKPGEILVQKDLAWSLKQIAQKGPDAFYKGAIARKIVADMERHGGHIDMQDLAAYEVKWRKPVTGSYRGYDIVAMPPPSSGGVAIVEALNIMESFPLGDWGISAKAVHVMVEAMKRTFADRGVHMADPDFYDVPVAWLTDKQRANKLAKGIDMQRATPSSELKGD
ncbi:MAG: gamma-glutamyltransferase, partial [Porticoccaceae bacterium]|nr:gamma-glutamyltransferase [Porticoccaceae bacterium]